MTLSQSLHGFIIGKCFLIQILVNRLKKCYYLEKNKIQVHPTINLNKVQVERVSYQKHLGVLLDEKLNFKQHVDSAISKVNKVISVIKRFRHNLPKKSLVTICKAFLRPLIDYDDIVNDHPQSESFCEKIESV